MQFSDDRGERIADTGHFSQAVFRNPSIKRLCQGFEALRRPYIGTGAERVCFGQRDPPPQLKEKFRYGGCIEPCHVTRRNSRH